MKRFLIALGALGLLASSASAQYYDPGWRRPPPPPGYYPPPPPPPVYQQPPRRYYGGPPDWRHARSYNWCQGKAARLYDFERRMQMDGRVSRDEARIANSLRADLQASCGGGRWAPNRGWYH